jgi:hypothetical protein
MRQFYIYKEQVDFTNMSAEDQLVVYKYKTGASTCCL